MNKVILKINPEKSTNTVSINGQPLSIYSELNNFLKEPFTTWSDRFFEMLEREINDDFELTVIASEKENEKLKTFAQKCAACEKYMYIPFSGDVEVKLLEFPKRIEKGETFLLAFDISDAAALPQIRVNVLNKTVIKNDGLLLTAVSKGETDIELYKEEELIPFEKFHMTVYQNNFIEKIELKVANNVLGINMEEPLDIKVFPPDAEDVTRLECFVEDDNIAKLTPDGKIITLSEGTTTVTVKGELVEEQVEIKVLPDISNVSVNPKSVKCFVGEVTPITVSLEPSYAFNKKYKWKSSDRSVAIIDSDEYGYEYIRATGLGHATITCYAEKGEASTCVDVNVGSTLMRKRTDSIWLKIMVYIFAAVIVSIAFDSMKVMTGLLVALYITGLITIVKEKSSIVWAILILAIPTIIIVHDFFLM